LDVLGNFDNVKRACERCTAAGIRVSLFLDADESQIDGARKAGAPVIEIHTGKYADATSPQHWAEELARIQRAALHANTLGLQVNAGHGLNYCNVQPIVAIPNICELNIGHAIIAEALFVGLEEAVRKMKSLLVGGSA
jgi:pyridoxine 5-phosphate synthase